MKKFIYKIIAFSLLIISISGFTLLFLPATPRVSKSLIFATIKKDSLLANTPPPRIILVGGSNLSMGLNSRIIKDSLQLNPVNTAIHAAFGIRYIIENTLQNIKKGDIIVLCMEYDHFFDKWDRSYEELFRVVFDIDKSKFHMLSFTPTQLLRYLKYTNKVISSRLNINEYFGVEEHEVYGVSAYNEYGDVFTYWDYENFHSDFEVHKAIDVNRYNPQVIAELKRIEDELHKKGCVLLISYPGYQDISFNNLKDAIKKVEEEFLINGFSVLGNPERYMMPDSLIFDTPYHLNKQGVDRRTKLLVEDLKVLLNE